MTAGALRPFFTFYGGKWRATPHYPAPAHPVIVEPFAGSAGYAVRHADRDVILVERDPIIAATWRYLITAGSDEIRALPLPGGWATVDDLDVPQGARYLIGFWLNKGMDSPCKSPSAWMRTGAGGRPGNYWGATIRERIAVQVDRVRHWQLIEGDYTAAPDVLATWFVDPPYQHAGRRYRFGSDRLDFAALGAWCRARSGQVVVCENDGADWLPFRPHMAAKATAGRRRTGVSRESIWTNDARRGAE